MAYTFVRTSELIQATWKEFEFAAARWKIPPERMKVRKSHIVPLSRQALAVLNELKMLSFGSDWVLPGDVGRRKCMSNSTIIYALYRGGYRNRMTGHGFRGVASIVRHEQGWPHTHIELQFAHQEQDDASAAYNHALYPEPRAKMMQVYSDFLDGLVKAPGVAT